MLVVPCPLIMFAPMGTVHVYPVALATAAIEYTAVGAWSISGQTSVGPDIAPGIAGITFVITSLDGALLVQIPPETLIVSVVAKLLLKLTVILVVPCPLTMVAPAGTTQLYVVAFANGAME